MKEEALKLAVWLDKSIDADDWGELAKYYQWCHENVSPMIRRLVEELDKQGEPVAWATEDLEDIMSPELRQAHIDHPQSCTHKFYPIPLYTTPQTKPLSEKELYEVFDKCYPNNGDGDVVTLVDFARAIEERHGIK